MKDQHGSRQLTEEGVQEDLQRQPYLFRKLAENALTVAESLRDNYFKNTAKFVAALRKTISQTAQGKSIEPILKVFTTENIDWSDIQGETVTFIDGGVGQVQLSIQVPILIRVGSYCVQTGERRITEREKFGYYPVIFGDLEGGSKSRRDFVDIVRITAELLGGLSALRHTPNLNVLMFHGPLVYQVWRYAGHTPFTEQDIDLFLKHYAPNPEMGQHLKEDFLNQAKLDIYPKMTERSDEWVERRLFEPLAWMSFLYRQLIQEARARNPIPIVVGVVERGDSQEFIERVLLERVFRHLRQKDKVNYFNNMYGRSDLTSSKMVLERLGYKDALLLAMLLNPGEYSEPWRMQDKYKGFRRTEVSLPGDVGASQVDFSLLKQTSFGFPDIQGFYIRTSENTEPIRLEVFEELGDKQVVDAASRVYLYSRLLPGYGFPVGLDIADKYAHVPRWLSDAYSKMIKHHLSMSLQQGEISDAEMRRMLVQAIYMTHRDWPFRPQA